MTQPVVTPCRKCGAALPEGAQDCARCGTPSLPPTGATLLGAPMPVTFAGGGDAEAEAKAGAEALRLEEAKTTPGRPLGDAARPAHDAPTQPTRRTDEGERFPPGTLILRQYRTVRRLGEGGMGSVYLARDDLSGQEVAVKVLPAALAREADIRERFVQEARALAALDHPAIVPLVTFARDGDDHFLVMKYVAGRSIEALIDEKGALDLDTCRQVFTTVVEALGYAHARGVIHRDVKPANVLLSDEGRIFLVDFGIAKSETSTRLTQTGMLMGTPQYMSPEQISGHVIDGRSDLYAAGLLLFEMLTGRPPFTGDKTFVILRQHVEAPVPDPRELRKGEIPRELLVVVDALLKKDPNQRPKDAAATLALLESAKSEGAASTPAFGESNLRFFDEPPGQLGQHGQHSTPLTTMVPALAEDDDEDLYLLERRAKRRVRAALASVLFGALLLFLAVRYLPDWAAQLELEGDPPPPPMPRIDPHDEAFALLLRKAQEHLNENEPRRAWAVLDAALAERPEDKTALFLKARALVQGERTSAARETLDQLAAREDLDTQDRELLENYRSHLERVEQKSGAKKTPPKAPAKTQKAPQGAAQKQAQKQAQKASPQSSPKVASAAEAAVPLTDEQLRTAAGKTRREARTCYETHVLKPASAAGAGAGGLPSGVVVLEVEIQPSGKVANVRTPENSFTTYPAVVSCLEGLARKWAFPTFEGAPIQFRYTYDFRPTL